MSFLRSIPEASLMMCFAPIPDFQGCDLYSRSR